MRRMIPCFACALCAIHTPIGFTSREAMLCTARDGEAVSKSDGCTLGEPGEPMTAVAPCDVVLSGHEAVSGGGDE